MQEGGGGGGGGRWATKRGGWRGGVITDILR